MKLGFFSQDTNKSMKTLTMGTPFLPNFHIYFKILGLVKKIGHHIYDWRFSTSNSYKTRYNNVVEIVARFQEDPREAHYAVVKRIFRYLY